MKFLRLPFALLMTGLLGLGGCTMHQPVALYQLDSGDPGQPSQSAGMAVVLGPVSVADYLQRETFLQRQADGSLSAATDGRWAGSLSSDIDQLLVRQLAWRLDSQRVVLAPATAGFSPDVQVLLSITRLDSGKTSRPSWMPSGVCWIAVAMCVTTVSFTSSSRTRAASRRRFRPRVNCFRSWPNS